MKTSDIKTRIANNTVDLVRLHKRIHETVLEREKSAASRASWKSACAEFHQRFNSLAFPGGYAEALEKFRAGDMSVLEPALCFLEVRPYFFRSGYMFSVLLRRVKRAPLTPDQQQRLDDVLARREAYRARKGRHVS
jgi:hypothetical protein